MRCARTGLGLAAAVVFAFVGGCKEIPRATVAVHAARPAPTLVTANAFTLALSAKNDWTWSGGDQAASYRASNGDVYWSFGDTVVGEEDPTTGGYRDGWQLQPNSILRQQAGGFTAATTGAAVPTAADGDRFWAMAMFEANDSFYVLSQRVRNTTDYFELRGVELAKFTIQPGGGLSFIGMVATPSTGLLGGTSPATAQYGLDAVVHDGFVYVFGLSTDRTDTASPQRSYVARVPVEHVETPSAWRFWTGGGWSPVMSQAAPILGAQLGSARYVDGRWVLAYKPWNCWGDTVLIETRLLPYDPPVATIRLRAPFAGLLRAYAPQLHPEQVLSSRKILLSISYNGRSLSAVDRDADLYKPRFFEVALPEPAPRVQEPYLWIGQTTRPWAASAPAIALTSDVRRCGAVTVMPARTDS